MKHYSKNIGKVTSVEGKGSLLTPDALTGIEKPRIFINFQKADTELALAF
jgi:hypothetical protein